MTNDATPSGKKSLIAAMGGKIRSAWNQRAVSTPEIDPLLTDLPAIERVAEVLRYKFLQIEFAISPSGGIRAWLRLNLLIAVTLVIPSLLVVPVVTWLLGSFVTMTGFLLAAAQNLLYTVVTIIALVSLVLAFGFGLKSLWKAHLRSEDRDEIHRR